MESAELAKPTEPPKNRLLCWWSAGAASAVASAVALKRYDHPIKIVAYCASTAATEHPDNARFLADCERWYSQGIERLYSTKYTDIWDVFQRTGWLVGVNGARCTTELKKLVRRAYEYPDDTHVFGFAKGEERRADTFVKNNPELDARFPLIETGLNHADCLALLAGANIEIPVMYRKGYKNNNCIGCVKGGAGYWNKIRVDFPDVFSRMAQLERKLDVAILKRTGPNKERLRVFLDELDREAGRYEAEPSVECGVACETTLQEIEK